tara:strand:+ start:418 stop:708 length:291 start_codon:yes stop_codon:yes gene_type:complete
MDNMQPTMTTNGFGNKTWKLHGVFHRTDGPAIEYRYGDKQWCLHGVCHRTDGPAIEYADGGKSWYLHGIWLSFAEWLDQTPDMTDEEKVMYKLEHG